MRIEVGYGLEGLLTDAVCARIISETLAPAFKQERYADGIRAAVQEMIRLSDVPELARPNAVLRVPLSDNYFLRLGAALLLMAFFLRGHWLRWSQHAVAAAILCLLYDRAFFVNPLMGEDTPQGLAAIALLLLLSLLCLPIVFYRKSTGASAQDSPVGFLGAIAYVALPFALVQLFGLAFRTSLGDLFTTSFYFGVYSWQYRRSVVDAEALKRHKHLPAAFSAAFAWNMVLALVLGIILLFFLGLIWGYFEHFVAYALWLALVSYMINAALAEKPKVQTTKKQKSYGGSSRHKKKGGAGGAAAAAAAASTYSDYRDYSDYSDSYSDYRDYSDSYSDYSDSSWGGGSSGGGGASGSW